MLVSLTMSRSFSPILASDPSPVFHNCLEYLTVQYDMFSSLRRLIAKPTLQAVILTARVWRCFLKHRAKYQSNFLLDSAQLNQPDGNVSAWVRQQFFTIRVSTASLAMLLPRPILCWSGDWRLLCSCPQHGSGPKNGHCATLLVGSSAHSLPSTP